MFVQASVLALLLTGSFAEETSNLRQLNSKSSDKYDDYKYSGPTAAPTPEPKDPKFFYKNLEAPKPVMMVMDPDGEITPTQSPVMNGPGSGQSPVMDGSGGDSAMENQAPPLVSRILQADFPKGEVCPFANGMSKCPAPCSYKSCFGFGDALVSGTSNVTKYGQPCDVLHVNLASFQEVTILEQELMDTTAFGPPTTDTDPMAADMPAAPTHAIFPGAEFQITCPCATQKAMVEEHDVHCACSSNHGECKIITKVLGSTVFGAAVGTGYTIPIGAEQDLTVRTGCDNGGFHASLKVTCVDKMKKDY